MKQQFLTWQTNWQNQWQTLAERERNLISLAVFFSVLALLYLLAFEPAWQGRAKLQKDLPKLRAQAEQMQVLVQKNAGLNLQAQENMPALSKEALEVMLAKRGIKVSNLSLLEQNIRLQISSANYLNLISLLAELHQQAHWQVQEARFSALPEAGMVAAQISLKKNAN